MMRYIGENKQLFKEVMAEWEAKKIIGGEKMLLNYIETSGLSEDNIFAQMDWEYIDFAEAAEAHNVSMDQA